MDGSGLASDEIHPSVVVPKSAILWIIPGADFGTTNHTRKQCFASVLIDSEVRKAADPGMAKLPNRDTGFVVEGEPVARKVWHLAYTSRH